MTNYNEWSESDEERQERRAKEKRERDRKERERVDKEFEEIVMKPKPKAKATCSANSDLVKYAKHLNAMKKALKAAEADGFCLDEIIDGLKELGND